MRTFLATTTHGLARVTGDGQRWSAETVLAGWDVRCLAADPRQRQTVYAGTQGRGLLWSADGGRTWQPRGLDGRVVKSLAVSPHESGVLYAGMKPPLVYESRDGGATWEELSTFRRIPFRWLWFSPAEPPFSAYVQALAISPTDPGVLLAGIEAGAVVRSTDGGRTWSGHRAGALRDCHSLIFHGRNGNWAYQGGAWFRGRGAAVSRDGGETWSAPHEGLDRAYGWAVAADPARPEVWYLSAAPGPGAAHGAGNARAGIFRSVGGAAWEKLGGGLPQPLAAMPYALLTDPAAPGHLYAGLSSGEIWHATDYGDTWRRLDVSLGRIERLVLLD